MDSLEQAIEILSLKPDRAEDQFSEARLECSRKMNAQTEFLRETHSLSDAASQKPFRDFSIEMSAPIEVYDRDESGKFICTGSISLDDLHKIQVHQSFREPDSEESTVTLGDEYVLSVQHGRIEAERASGEFTTIGSLEVVKGYSSYHIIEKEFIAITFQRSPHSSVEQAFIRCTIRDEEHGVPFKREDITPSDPDYPFFHDPRLLERVTIRVSPIE